MIIFILHSYILEECILLLVYLPFHRSKIAEIDKASRFWGSKVFYFYLDLRACHLIETIMKNTCFPIFFPILFRDPIQLPSLPSFSTNPRNEGPE